jgi:hypothetical protein
MIFNAERAYRKHVRMGLRVSRSGLLLEVSNPSQEIRMKPVCFAVFLFALSPLCWAHGSERIEILADRPIAYMVSQGRCEMTGAVIVGEEPASGATITLKRGDTIVAKARTNPRGIYRVEFSASAGDTIQEASLSVPPSVGSRALVRLDSSMTKPTATCKNVAITVGEVDRI